MSEIVAGTEPARTTTAPSTTDQPAAQPARRPVWKHGLVAAVLASGATTLIATGAHATGETFENQGAGIPPIAFTQLTLLFSLVGVGLAAILARTARRPRRAFLVTTVVLTALSVVPDVSDVQVTPVTCTSDSLGHWSRIGENVAPPSVEASTAPLAAA
jgi:hypothetical protein